MRHESAKLAAINARNTAALATYRERDQMADLTAATDTFLGALRETFNRADHPGDDSPYDSAALPLFTANATRALASLAFLITLASELFKPELIYTPDMLEALRYARYTIASDPRCQGGPS